MNKNKLLRELNKLIWKWLKPCEFNKENPPRIYIEVAGGCIQQVRSNIKNLPVEIIIADHDIEPDYNDNINDWDEPYEIPETVYPI